MKYLVAMVIMGLGIYGLTSASASAGGEPTQVLEHHSTQHSQGPCGPVRCPPKDGK